jgi:hypothetical protein
MDPDVKSERTACSSFLRFLQSIIQGNAATAGAHARGSEKALQHNLITKDPTGRWHINAAAVADAIDHGRHHHLGQSAMSEGASMGEREEITKFEGDRGGSV